MGAIADVCRGPQHRHQLLEKVGNAMQVAILVLVMIVWMPLVAVAALPFGLVGGLIFVGLSLAMLQFSQWATRSRLQRPRVRIAFEAYMVVAAILAMSAPFVQPLLSRWSMYRAAAPLPELGAAPVLKRGFICRDPEEVTDDVVLTWVPHLSSSFALIEHYPASVAK